MATLEEHAVRGELVAGEGERLGLAAGEAA